MIDDLCTTPPEDDDLDDYDRDDYDGYLDDDWDGYDRCYECGGYGDDYFVNDEGELESACPTCPFNPNRYDDDDDDGYYDD